VRAVRRTQVLTGREGADVDEPALLVHPEAFGSE
jgi:hypothetical protein